MTEGYDEIPEIEYMAFAVKGDNTIDIERYRCSVDMDTNASDFVYDGDRISLHTLPLLTISNFIYDLWAAGWQDTGDFETTDTGWQATVERGSE